MEGFSVKNYVVDRLVGKGPQGNVYIGKRVSDGVLCAVKEFSVHHLTQEEKEDAAEDLRVLATVQNENVISYYDSFVHEHKVFVVMEYCDDRDLGKQIKARADQQKFFSEGQIWSYFIQMLRGLIALHSKGIVYRNMRSGNVIQLDSNVIKLGDAQAGNLTKEGPATAQIGNPHYVPPEVWENQSYTFKSDVWALGCVLYELTALCVPFGGCSLPELRLKVIKGLYQPIPSLFSYELSTVLKLLLTPDQALRISSRDMLLHPIVQAHLQHAPAPLLRVQSFGENIRLGSIPGLSMFGPSSTLGVVADSQPMQWQALLLKQSALTPPAIDRHSGLSNEKAAVTSVQSKIVPILTPRAILSSPDNDKMLSELNRPPNQVSKVKVPRVAMLGKVALKSSVESSVGLSPQGLTTAVSSGVNLKYFKTAYIQPPKVDSDEFRALPMKHDRFDATKKKLENLADSPGMSKLKPPATPTKVATLKKKHSGESVKSGSSSQSDDSAICIRAPISVLESSHTEPRTWTRDNAADSARSVTSSQSEDSILCVRAPIDPLDTNYTAVATPRRVDVASSGQLTASSGSDSSTISVRPTVRGRDSAKSVTSSHLERSVIRVRAPIDPLDTSHTGVATPRRVDLASSGRSTASSGCDGSTTSVRLTVRENDSAEYSPEHSESLKVAPADLSIENPSNSGGGGQEKLKDYSGTHEVSNTNPVSSHIMITMERGDDALDSLKSVASNGVLLQGSGDPLVLGREDLPESAQRLINSSGSKTLCFDNLRTDKPDCTPVSPTASVTGKVPSPTQVPSSRKNNAVKSVGGVGKKASSDTVRLVRAPGDGSNVALGHQASARSRRLSFDGIEKERLEDHGDLSGSMKTKRAPSHSKLAMPRQPNSAELLKPVSDDSMARAHLRHSLSLVQTADDGLYSVPRQQKSTGNRRLSLDFPRTDKPETQTLTMGVSKMRSSNTKVSLSGRESSVDSLKGTVARNSMAVKDPSDVVTRVRPQADGAVQNPPKPSAHHQSTFDSVKKDNSGVQRRTPGVLKAKPVAAPTKIGALRHHSTALSKPVPKAATPRRKSPAVADPNVR